MAREQHNNLTSERLLADLQSPDEMVRVRAVHAVCPCEAGPELFEKHRAVLAKMKKDPSPLVREIALHIFNDSDENHSDGLPTRRAEATNEMLRTRRQSRFKREEKAASEDNLRGRKRNSGRGG